MLPVAYGNRPSLGLGSVPMQPRPDQLLQLPDTQHTRTDPSYLDCHQKYNQWEMLIGAGCLSHFKTLLLWQSPHEQIITCQPLPDRFLPIKAPCLRI